MAYATGDVVTLTDDDCPPDPEGVCWMSRLMGVTLTLGHPAGDGIWNVGKPDHLAGYHVSEHWFVGGLTPAPSVPECSCPLIFKGCTCGAFKAEMASKGKVYDQWLKSYV